MKSYRYILAFGLLFFVLGSVKAQDFARMSEQTIMGTARYTGMSGAMTAIGGDPSAAADNPAGLGLYRRAEVLVSLGGNFDRARQTGTGNNGWINSFTLPHVSLVMSLPVNNPSDEGVQFHNFMFSYQALHSFNRNWRAAGGPDASLGAVLGGLTEVKWDIPFCVERYNSANALTVVERGYVNQFSFDWAMNISNRWFVGAGLQIQSLRLSSDGNFKELFADVDWYNENRSTLIFTGTTCTFSAGLIYRPLGWLRLGFGIKTPSLGSLRTFTAGALYAMTDSLRVSTAPDCVSRDGSFHLPLHLSTSVAFQISAYALLALQYDFSHAKQMADLHSLRAGFEVIPVMGMYINGGYAIESSFKRSDRLVPIDPLFERQDAYFMNTRWTQYVSAAVGYRGTYVMVQAAYQYRWQHSNLYAHEYATPYDINADTHRIVVTIGWHKD